MAFTTDDLAAIDAAIASGELTVQQGDRQVTYRSIGDLERARRIVKAELDSKPSSSGVRRGAYAVRFTTARGD